jgi:hypothetical protein
VLITIATTAEPATDLGFLLHKNPSRPQAFDVSVGTAHVFYPEATDQRCTVALLLEVDPICGSLRSLTCRPWAGSHRPTCPRSLSMFGTVGGVVLGIGR